MATTPEIKRPVRKLGVLAKQAMPNRAPEERTDQVFEDKNIIEAEPNLKEIFAEEWIALQEQLRDEVYQNLLSEAKSEAEIELKKKREELDEERNNEQQLHEKTLGVMKNAIDQLKEAELDAILGQEASIVKLVMEILYQVVGDAHSYKKIISDATGHVLSSLKEDKAPKVKLCRSDYKLVMNLQPSNTEIFIVDESLKPGELKITSGDSVYDASLIHQLDIARTVLINTLRENSER